ncbi:MAG: putative hydrolase, partial [Modestobacter sp.]|nr:putative hydrolase [Modestobacter sp.]
NVGDQTAVPGHTTVRIGTPSGDELEAWLYLPDGDGPYPAVVMAHGIGAIKAGGLAPFADRFCHEGFAAVVFDYRQWGGSDGQPREELSFPRQLEDYSTVIGWAAAQPQIDARRVFAWGTSFAGMYIVELAASDARLAGAIAQAPLVDGLAAAMMVPPPRSLRLRLLGLAVRDRLGALLGRAPIYLPGAGAPGTLAVGSTPNALFGQEVMTPTDSTVWHNRVAARSRSASPGAGRCGGPPTFAARSFSSSPSTTRWRRPARRFASPTQPLAVNSIAVAAATTTSTREARASTTCSASSSTSSTGTPRLRPGDKRRRGEAPRLQRTPVVPLDTCWSPRSPMRLRSPRSCAMTIRSCVAARPWSRDRRTTPVRSKSSSARPSARGRCRPRRRSRAAWRGSAALAVLARLGGCHVRRRRREMRGIYRSAGSSGCRSPRCLRGYAHGNIGTSLRRRSHARRGRRCIGRGSDPFESEVAKWRTSRRVRLRMYSPRRW